MLYIHTSYFLGWDVIIKSVKCKLYVDINLINKYFFFGDTLLNDLKMKCTCNLHFALLIVTSHPKKDKKCV